MVYRLEGDKLNADSIEPLIRTVLMRPRTRAFVIGAGSLLDVFLRRVEKAGVRDNFVFTGYVPYAELPDYYAQFRTFVAPVWQESFGQVAAFAMNMGLAVAGNRIGALPEILGSDDTLGGSIEETAAILVALLEDPDKIRNLGAHNRTRAQQMFEVADMCRKYTSVYQDVLGESDPMPGFPPAEIFAEL
jgi:glycosyltransferase involved in cell wall biosynthesis